MPRVDPFEAPVRQRLDPASLVFGDDGVLLFPALHVASAEPGAVVGHQPGPVGCLLSPGTLWLSPDELTELLGKLVEALQPSLGNEPTPDRSPYLLSPILFPAEPPTP
ncbi:hypothetical protein SAMN05428945_5041 [Streptomyces sp. 2224.1]|uniref:hypothetical protein n=1 Tax=unclassified Streptomyces TaxID=2593676 RepID=UPI0008945020|nr:MULTISPECIES: hypothetical protein [unclassified Streptomyces]PBC80466.1 hypothetical protein BX261_0291 [Streptomyces sp. 2321.6]SEB75799.1 hypothetical protein SAMN05428940_0293 [Streptomyces sp. 2133.1]SED48618.1 hypothetical protein SAMN05428945_5041 [Streptomyces sp. 2224.1]SNC60575.1 hypothetical protein SAMN06272741_0293 [Streptomyces sp. 2114.4]